MELLVFLPGMLLAYFPVKQYLRLRPHSCHMVSRLPCRKASSGGRCLCNDMVCVLDTAGHIYQPEPQCLPLAEVQGNIPTGDLRLCENAVVDSVAGYFAPLYKENGIPLSFGLDLPSDLPVPDTDLCSVLSNLLENAMEASLHSGNMLLLSVENNHL